MATVYASAGDGWRRKQAVSAASWGGARGGAGVAGTGYNTISASYAFAIHASFQGGRGGNTYYCTRAYFPFNLSSESGTISSATLEVYLEENDSAGSDGGVFADIVAVQATALSGNNDDHGNCFSSGATLGTTLTDTIRASKTAGFHTFTFNSSGISAMQSLIGSGTLTICIMNAKFDHGNISPVLNGDRSVIDVDFSQGSNDAYLDITYGAAAAVTDNATFFGANF